MINIAKNVNGESANKFTTFKLIVYNRKMPTNNMINLNHQNINASGFATLTPKSLID